MAACWWPGNNMNLDTSHHGIELYMRNIPGSAPHDNECNNQSNLHGHESFSSMFQIEKNGDSRGTQ